MDTTRWIRRDGAIEKLPSRRMQKNCHPKYLIVPSKMPFLYSYLIYLGLRVGVWARVGSSVALRRARLRRLKGATERPTRPPLHSHQTAIEKRFDGIWMAKDGIFYRYPKFFDGVPKIYRARNIDRWQKILPSKISASIVRFSFCRPLLRTKPESTVFVP